MVALTLRGTSPGAFPNHASCPRYLGWPARFDGSLRLFHDRELIRQQEQLSELFPTAERFWHLRDIEKVSLGIPAHGDPRHGRHFSIIHRDHRSPAKTQFFRCFARRGDKIERIAFLDGNLLQGSSGDCGSPPPTLRATRADSISPGR